MLLIARVGSFERTLFSNTIFVNEQKILTKAVECLKKAEIIGNYVILSTRCSSASASNSLSRARPIERVGRIECVPAR